MNFLEWFFMLQLVICLGVTIVKILNLMKSGELYSLPYAFLGFITYVLFWGLGLVCMFFSIPSNNIGMFTAVMTLTSLLLMLNLGFLFGEILFNMKESIEKPYKAYSPR